MKIHVGTLSQLHWLLITIACGMIIVSMAGCHICHEELNLLFIFFGSIPFLGAYVIKFKIWLHNKRCIHKKEN